MITVLTGENSFELARALEVLRTEFDGEPEMVDGADLELRQLPDLIMGATLFSPTRQVIIKDLTNNKTVWPVFDEWIGRVAEDVQLILVEPQLDKRTKTYKALKASADVREFASWKDSDTGTALRWLADEVKARGLTIDAASQRALVGQIGADQWQLHYALEKLAVLDTVTPQVIEAVIERAPHENIFVLLDTALAGDRAGVRRAIATLEHTEEAYRLFGLLATQITQLAALTLTDQSPAETAAALGVHPFALTKLQKHASRLERSGARHLVRIFVEADHRLKTGSDNPWVVLETALMHIAARNV